MKMSHLNPLKKEPRTPKVRLEKHDGYAIVTLNRPDSMNALSRELRTDFVDAFEQCSADPTLRAVVLTGEGQAFCAGFDLKELAESDTDMAQEADNRMAEAMAAFPGVIIGAINGHAITGGFELALACDILLASERARFADTHAQVGVLPGWGLSQKLPRLIGLPRAKEMAFTGKPIFAQQALEWGIVNHVIPEDRLLRKAVDMAKSIRDTVPGLTEQYKALIEEGYSMPYHDALAWEEQQAIESAKQAAAAMIAERKDDVLKRGRAETRKTRLLSALKPGAAI